MRLLVCDRCGHRDEWPVGGRPPRCSGCGGYSNGHRTLSHIERWRIERRRRREAEAKSLMAEREFRKGLEEG